ncbi:MAG: hypothetical protein MOB07_01805 [Acidobacteria bacterium]|nr:hypothetical protein [Acidobacteriota bacterium]
MKKLTFEIATCFCLILSSSTMAQTKRVMTYDDIMALKTVGSTAISPDGKQALYTLSYTDMKANERRAEIWIVSTEKGAGDHPNAKPRRFTSGKNDGSPQWAPDGQTIAFISTRDAGEAAKPQVYLISAFGGEAEKLTDSKTGVSSFAWSRDSKHIAYVAQRPFTEAEEKKQKDKDDAQVVDSGFRFTSLWVIDVNSTTSGSERAKASEIVKNDWVVSDPQFSPDGKRLSFTAHPTPKADDGSLGDIYIANSDGSGSMRKLYENAGPDSGARWSPDGKWISFSSRDAKMGMLGLQRLYIVSAEGGVPRAVAPGYDNNFPAVVWSRDGSTLYFAGSSRTTSQIFSVPAAGGEVKPISSGAAVIGGVSFAHDAGKVAFTRSDIQRPGDVYVSSLSNFNPAKLTDHNPQLSGIALGRGEIIRWKSKDGMEIEGVLIFPVNYEAGKRYPTIANIHGGPSGVWTQAFPGSHGNYAHIWAGKGWVVFLFFPREGHGLQEPRHQLDKMKREYAHFAKYVLGVEEKEDKKETQASTGNSAGNEK